MADAVELGLGKLPYELFLQVVEDPSLSTKDLAAFVLASSQYDRWVTPVLYKKNIREENASAFLWAVLEESTGTMHLLVEHGADINSVEASMHVNQPSPYRWMKRLCGSDLDAQDYRIPEALRSLHEEWNDFRYSPLALAAREGLVEATEFLLEHGADPEVTARHLCFCENDLATSISTWLVPRNATSSTSIDHPQWTPLHLAAQFGHTDVVHLLIDHGANTQQVCRPEDGPCSVLHTAFLHRQESTIKSLMSQYRSKPNIVDINAQGRDGITPAHIAYSQGPPSLVGLALSFGAYVNLEYEVDQNQWTLFAMACMGEDWGFALRLLKLGASPDFDIVLPSGVRWATDTFRRDMRCPLDGFRREFVCGRRSMGTDSEAEALIAEMDQVARDQQSAYE